MTTYSSSGFSFPASNFKESDKLLLHFTPTVGADLVVLAILLVFQPVRVQQEIIGAHSIM